MEAATSRSEFTYSLAVKELHNEMVQKLSQEIAPTKKMRDDWDRLLNLFSNNAPLSTVQIDDISNIGGLVKLLLDANYIRFDDYEPLASKLAHVHPRMANLIREYSMTITEQIRMDRGDDSNR